MMKRRVFGMLLSLCLVLALIPAAVLAEDAATLELTAPYTTIVQKDGSVKPGETVFKLKLMNDRGKVLKYAKVSGTSVTTNGVGSYAGELTITGSFGDLMELFSPFVFVQQVDEGKDGWEYDDKVWCLVCKETIAASYSLDDAAPEEEPSGLLIYPTSYTKDDDGGYYNLDEDKGPVKKMTFVNTYTKEKADVSSLPKTGDSSSLTGWLILLAVSAAAVAGAVVYSRRRKNAREE